MKTPKLILTIFITLIVLYTFAQNDSITVKEIIKVGNAGMKNYLEKIPVGNESLYGFNNRYEFENAVLSKPYQVVTLNKEFFNDNDITDKNYLMPTNEWRVPITLNGEYRVLLTVAKMNGELKTVGIGAAILAKELGEFEKKHPSLNQVGTMLRVYQLTSDFVLLTPNDSISLQQAYPLTSANIALGNNNDKSTKYSLSQLLPLIKKNINSNKN